MESEYSDREEKPDICTGSPEKTYVNSTKVKTMFYLELSSTSWV
jgi:hypothetical protein